MEIPIEIDHGSVSSLQAQIFEHFRHRILCGGLKAGTPVPASRALAGQLGVSRNTVLLAYDRLIAEGYLQARVAIGTFVSLELPETCLATARPAVAPAVVRGEPSSQRAIPFAGRAQAVVSAHRVAHDFWLGRPDAHSFPIKSWRRLTNKALATAGARLTEYRDPAGLPELRQAIADHLAAARGVSVSSDQVIITAGSQSALNLVARLLVREGTPVATENPCYQGAAFLFESHRARMVPVPVDEAGLDVEQLPRQGVMLVYVTPSHQYPLGFTLSLERRLKLIDWARRCGAYIIEDDYDSDFRYRGSPLTALMGLDQYGCVMYLGTFSKSIGAGLRLGYLVVPKALAKAARSAKALLDNGHPWLDQAVMAEFIRSGAYGNHLRRIRQLYCERRDCLVEALHRHFGDVRLSGLESGMHLAWHLPEQFPDAPELQALALRKGVGVYSLSSGAAHDYGGCDYSDRTVVLGFSSLDEHRIRAGIQGIADALADLPAMSRRSSVASAAALVVSSRRPTSGSHRPSRSGRRPRH